MKEKGVRGRKASGSPSLREASRCASESLLALREEGGQLMCTLVQINTPRGSSCEIDCDPFDVITALSDLQKRPAIPYNIAMVTK